MHQSHEDLPGLITTKVVALSAPSAKLRPRKLVLVRATSSVQSVVRVVATRSSGGRATPWVRYTRRDSMKFDIALPHRLYGVDVWSIILSQGDHSEVPERHRSVMHEVGERVSPEACPTSTVLAEDSKLITLDDLLCKSLLTVATSLRHKLDTDDDVRWRDT